MARVGKDCVVALPGHITKALGIKEGDEVDFDLIDERTVAIRKAGKLGAAGVAVLKRISGIRFAERTKEKVERELSLKEMKVLVGLVEKGAVSYYEKGKYKGKGVYSISRDYYSYSSGEKEKPGSVVDRHFGSARHLIITDAAQAQEVLGQLEGEVKRGNIVTVRGFDRNFYITTSETVNDVGSKVMTALAEGKEITLDGLASSCGIDKGLAKTVIEVLRESGDIIERKRELYSLA